MKSEIEELNKEIERLWGEQKQAKEIKRLKKEIWYLKYPIFLGIQKTMLNIFNFLANMGDKIIKPKTNNHTKKHKNKQPSLDDVIKQFEKL
jgi:ribosomal protein S6